MEQTLFELKSRRKFKVAETYIKLRINYNYENNSKIRKTLIPIIQSEIEKLQLPGDITYEIQFEEGSTKIRVAIFAAIIFYGDIRDGINMIYNDVKWLSENIIQTARQQDDLIDNNVIRTERRTALTGRLKRTLDRIEYLRGNLNALNHNEIHAELTRLYQDLANIIQLLDNIDRETFLNSLPNDLHNNLPPANDAEVVHLNNLYALKPEEQE